MGISYFLLIMEFGKNVYYLLLELFITQDFVLFMFL